MNLGLHRMDRLDDMLKERDKNKMKGYKIPFTLLLTLSLFIFLSVPVFSYTRAELLNWGGTSGLYA